MGYVGSWPSSFGIFGTRHLSSLYVDVIRVSAYGILPWGSTMAENVQFRVTWPLIFSYRGNVFGQGYFASVSAVSRVLGIQEEDGIWLSGVQPGGIAAGGQDLWEARVAFRQAFVGVLADIASSVGDFPAFQAEVARFLEERDDRAFEEWAAAVDANRRKPLDWAQMKQLPIMSAGMTPSMTAVLRSEMTPADNLIDEGPELATAA